MLARPARRIVSRIGIAVFAVALAHAARGQSATSALTSIPPYPPPPPPITLPVSVTPDPGDGPITQPFKFTAGCGCWFGLISWDFGDGQTSSSPSLVTTHTYARTGVFTVTAKVNGLWPWGPNGAPASGTGTTVVIVRPPMFQVMPVANPPGGPPPFTTAFHAWVVGGTPGYTFTWDFGDGKSGSGQDVSHTYEKGGTYVAVVTAADAQGLKASGSQSVSVYVMPTIGVSISAAPPDGMAPVTVKYVASATGGTAPYTYVWMFPDGSTQRGTQASYTYSIPGTWSASVTVTDANGATAVMGTPAVDVYPRMTPPGP
jgi:PKD repeat protein